MANKDNPHFFFLFFVNKNNISGNLQIDYCLNNVLQDCRQPITNRRNSPRAYNLANDLEITNPQREYKKSGIFVRHKLGLTSIYQLSEKKDFSRHTV